MWKPPEISPPKWLKPETVVFVLFGLYGLPDNQDWFASWTLVAGLIPFGVSPAAARMTLSRMKKRGYLRSERVGKEWGYRLTPSGQHAIERGKALIRATWSDGSFRPAWDGRWTVVAFTIPQEQRPARDNLRSWLKAGHKFGQLTRGTYVRPWPLTEEEVRYLDSPERSKYVSVMRSTILAPKNPLEVVHRAWPELKDLARDYEEFSYRYSSITDPMAVKNLDLSKLFAWRITSMSEFVELLLRDPELPDEITPVGWPGKKASDAFHSAMRVLVRPSLAFIESLKTPRVASHGK